MPSVGAAETRRRREWPVSGLPQSLHLDGAAEFRSKARNRRCGQYGIELVYRVRPHHRGHIERFTGTKTQKLKALPGATGDRHLTLTS